MAYDRLRISDNDTSNTVEADPWSDLEPHRTTAAIIGVLNMKDCRDTNDLWAAEKSLMEWANRYDTTLNNANSNKRSSNNNNSDNNGNNIIIRLFVFDSFEESIQQRVNISETRLCHSSQIVAFPPLEMAHSQMMALHWNVVVNDLAVSLFRSVEGKIRRNDLLSKSIASGNTAVGGGAINSGGGGGIGGGIQAAKGGVAALLDLLLLMLMQVMMMQV